MRNRAFTAAAALLIVLPVSAVAEPALVSVDGTITHYAPGFFSDAHPNTAYDMVSRLPGFAFDDGGTARGYAGNAGNVVIDGERPVAKTDDLQAILRRIPASDVARIDVIHGSAPGIDMHGQSVIANVVRKSAASTTIVAGASANIWATGHTTQDYKLEYTSSNDGWLYEGSLERFANFDDSVGSGSHVVTDAAGNVTRQHAQNTGAGEGYRITGAVTMPFLSGQFKTNLTLEQSPFNSSLTYTLPGYRADVVDQNAARKAELGLRWTRHWQDFGINALFLQRLGHTTDRNLSRAPGDFEQFSSRNDTGESIARVRLNYTGVKNLTIEGGGEAVFNYLDGISAYDSNGVNVPLPGGNAYVSERRGEVFSDATWQFAPEWSLLAGIRAEFSTISETGAVKQTRSLFYPKPRAVLSYTPREGTQWRLRVERVVGQLDFSNFVASSNLATSGVSAGNADLLPDDHMQYALSYERHFWKDGAVVVTLLHDEISDAVDHVPIVTQTGIFDAPGNIGNATDNEIDIEATLPLDRIGIPHGLIKMSNIWRDSTVTDPVTGQTRRLSNQRPHAIQVSLSQDLQRWHSTWGIDFDDVWDQSYWRVQQYEHDQVNPPYLQAYWEYKPESGWALRFEADNIVPYYYKQDVVTYAGLRSLSPVAQTEEIAIRSRPRIFISIRKTW